MASQKLKIIRVRDIVDGHLLGNVSGDDGRHFLGTVGWLVKFLDW
jgi:hypothetical protein